MVLCTRQLVLHAIATVVLIFVYYFFSITLIFYNKKFITVYPFPLSITFLHMVVKFLLAFALRSSYEMFYDKRVELDWTTYAKRIACTGIAGSLDIGLSNWSYEYITISLFTMTKSTSIIFILLFSLIFRLERQHWGLIFVVLFIAVGLFLFTYHSTQFNLIGFLLVLSSSVISGFRWTTAQLVTQKSEIGLANPVDMMYHVQPWMILTLLPLCTFIEGADISLSDQLFGFHSLHTVTHTLLVFGCGALFAFCLEFSQFLLVCRTSSLTLSIAGIFKEVATLCLAAWINGDRMTPVNGVGLLVCLAGIVLHVAMKATVERGANGAALSTRPRQRRLSGSTTSSDYHDSD